MTMLAIGILGLIGLVVAGGFSLRSQLDKLKIELASAKKDAQITNERLMDLQREVGQIQQNRSSPGNARSEDQLSAMAQPTSPLKNVMQINATEGKLIREFLGENRRLQADG